jgi:ZIP family zinc transporter
MISPLGGVLPYAVAPVVAASASGAIAAFRPPTDRLRSVIEHVAAGVVLAAAAVEVIPTALGMHRPWGLAIGFALGIALMLGVQALNERVERAGEGREGTPVPVGLIATVAIDLLIDGLLLGVVSAQGAKGGLLLGVAYTIEMVSLGLATAGELGQARLSRPRQIAVTSGLALVFLVGTAAGVLLLGGLSGAALAGFYGGGTVVLLYLAAEELLTEAHEVRESLLATATFLGGFLVLLVIDSLS